jgi:hypothetical protein
MLRVYEEIGIRAMWSVAQRCADHASGLMSIVGYFYPDTTNTGALTSLSEPLSIAFSTAANG